MNKEILTDLYEIINNLEDDMELDIPNGEEGYKSYEESYNAIKKYTHKVIMKKIKKWEKYK